MIAFARPFPTETTDLSPRSGRESINESPDESAAGLPGELATEPSDRWTANENRMLIQCENRIANGERSFWHIGTALHQIHENRLYRQSHETFDQYVEERWEMSSADAYRKINAAKLMTRLQESLQFGETDMPARESHVRPLIGLPPKHQVRAWLSVIQHSRSEGVRITAKLVEQKVDEILNRLKKQPKRKRAPKPEPAPVQWNPRTRHIDAFVFELGVSSEQLAEQIRDAALVWHRQQRVKPEEAAAILKAVAQEILTS